MTERENLGPFTLLLRYRGRIALGSLMLIATNILALMIPWALGRTIDALQAGDAADRVPTLAMFMIALAIVQAIVRIASRIQIFNAGRMAEHDLRQILLGHLLRVDLAYLRDHTTGDVMSRLTNDVQVVRAMWGVGTLNLINTTFVFLFALILMLSIDPWLTLWALVPYPSMVVIGVLFGRWQYRANQTTQRELGALSGSLQEDLTGISVIKAYAIERERTERFGVASARLLRANMVATMIRGSLAPVLGITASLGTVVVLWLGVTAVVEQRIRLGELIQFNGYLAMLVWPTLALGWMLSVLQRGMASWSRLSDLLATRPRIVDGPGPALDPATVRGDLSIRHLTIELGGRKLLDDVSIEVPAGTVTAIVGRVGSGKTTLVEAIPRLYDVPRGTVFVDGHDITDLAVDDLRRCIGYAPQEAFLFSASVADNIGYSLTDAGSRLADDELARAARVAGLSRDVAILPAGYDTVVGERGVLLSGGQRQRVALARAVAVSPRILILDDSLSSVDAETEREILGHLTQVMAGRTSILISHRVAAVRRADQIAVLDEGRVVELGTHRELLASRGLYAELYQTQLAEAELEGAVP